jgi:ArsR family transcriptional regulator
LTIFDISHIRYLDPTPEDADVKKEMQDNLRRFKAGIFQALAHPTRIAIVELLRDEHEVPVSRIHEQLGLEQANASQHLAILRGKLIVVGRKQANQVLYSLRDPVIGKVLNLMRQYFKAHLHEALALLEDMKSGAG